MRQRGSALLWCVLFTGCQVATPPQATERGVAHNPPGAAGQPELPTQEAAPQPPAQVASPWQKSLDYAYGALTVLSLPVLLPLMLLRPLWDPIKC
jgi:hypothetical protein